MTSTAGRVQGTYAVIFEPCVGIDIRAVRQVHRGAVGNSERLDRDADRKRTGGRITDGGVVGRTVIWDRVAVNDHEMAIVRIGRRAPAAVLFPNATSQIIRVVQAGEDWGREQQEYRSQCE